MLNPAKKSYPAWDAVRGVHVRLCTSVCKIVKVRGHTLYFKECPQLSFVLSITVSKACDNVNKTIIHSPPLLNWILVSKRHRSNKEMGAVHTWIIEGSSLRDSNGSILQNTLPGTGHRPWCPVTGSWLPWTEVRGHTFQINRYSYYVKECPQ